MTNPYKQALNPLNTPQTEPLYPSNVPNNAGGQVFAVDGLTQFRRFLILGSAGGSYYVSEKTLTKENLAVVEKVIEDRPLEALAVLEVVSDQGLAQKQSPTLVALAIAASSTNPVVRKLAIEMIPRICRIPTHLFEFLEYLKQRRKINGRSLRNALASWYNKYEPKQLAYHMTKYQSREGWTHRDVLRLAHPSPRTKSHEYLFGLATGKNDGTKGILEVDTEMLTYLAAVDSLRLPEMTTQAKVSAIKSQRLPREVIPTEMLNDPRIWEALLQSMPMTATVRNLAKMTAVGLIAPLSEASRLIYDQLTDQEHLVKSRIHPLTIFQALGQYSEGKGDKGSLEWKPVPKILEALEAAFYLSFKNVKPTRKQLVIAVDSSGSMQGGGFSYRVGMNPWKTPVMQAAAIAAVFGSAEADPILLAYDHNVYGPFQCKGRGLLDIVQDLARGGGSTDGGLPIQWVKAQKLESKIEGYIWITDAETWSGRSHVETMWRGLGSRVRGVELCVTPSRYTMFQSPNMLQIAGFDASVHEVSRMFLTGEV